MIPFLVFGASGQVARALAASGGFQASTELLGRDRVDLMVPGRGAAALAAFAARHPGGAVINAAAYTAVDQAETDADAAHRLNAEAPGELARAAAAHGLPFLHISTDYVFDGSGEAPWPVDGRISPLNAYGRTKAAGEAAVRAAGGAHAILRTSWVFSAHGTNFVKTMLRLGAARDTLSIVADQVGGPTHATAIAGAARAMVAGLAADPSLSGTYHFAGAPDVSWAGFAEAIFAAAGLACAVTPIPSADYPTPAARPRNSRLECRATEAAFGIARPDWRVGLRDVLKELDHG
ncbi:MAG: dTDP-4-dehydrorhamnose reductase [Pseudomonadota bacterium]